MHSITSKDIVIFRHHQQLITENMILFLSIANKKKTFTTDKHPTAQSIDTHMKKYSIPKPATFTQLQDVEF